MIPAVLDELDLDVTVLVLEPFGLCFDLVNSLIKCAISLQMSNIRIGLTRHLKKRQSGRIGLQCPRQIDVALRRI